MSAPHTSPLRSPRSLALLALLAGAVAGVPASASAAAKGAAPLLRVEAKACQIGALVEQRSVSATASAVLRDAGDRVALRFTLQQRLDSGKWQAIWAKSKKGLGTWEIGGPDRAGLRYTKTVTNLDEGVRYRLVIDARGIAEDGHAVTKTARRSVTCIQPRFTPDVRLSSAEDSLAGNGDHVLTATLTNAGRLPSATSVVTVMDHATRAVLGRLTVDSIKGQRTLRVRVPLTGCTGKLFVVVEDEAGADGAPASSRQLLTPVCATPQG
jgi:hypothetical protein